MLSRYFTKPELHLNQLKHKQLTPQFDFAILQNNTLQQVHYLIKREEVLTNQKHDSHPILADYGTDQFSILVNDQGNEVIVNPLDSFFIKSVTPFQSNFKTPTKKHNKLLYQQSFLLNDTDIISDDQDHIYTRNSKDSTLFTPDTTITSENVSTITNPKSDNHSTYAIELQQTIQLPTHCSQIIPFYDPSFFKYKIYFQGLFLTRRLLFRYNNT